MKPAKIEALNTNVKALMLEIKPTKVGTHILLDDKLRKSRNTHYQPSNLSLYYRWHQEQV